MCLQLLIPCRANWLLGLGIGYAGRVGYFGDALFL